jgi:hypothetical protein
MEPDGFSFFLLGRETVGDPKQDARARRGSAGATGFAP